MHITNLCFRYNNIKGIYNVKMLNINGCSFVVIIKYENVTREIFDVGLKSIPILSRMGKIT